MGRLGDKAAAKVFGLIGVTAAVIVVMPAGEPGVTLPNAAAATVVKARPIKPEVAQVRMADVTKARPAQLAQRNTARFSMLGLTWEPRADDGVLAQVRVRSNKKWSSWQTVPVDDEHGPDKSERQGRGGTDPLWVGEADGVQAKVTTLDGKAVKGVSVSLIDPQVAQQDEPASLDAAVMPAATTLATPKPAPYARPPIYNRASWGADESLRNYNPDCAVPKYGSTIKGAYVHHTAGSNSYTSSQSASLIRGIYAFHVKSRGWCDIGYNFLVDRYGRTFEGRYGGILDPVIGAHTEGHNTDTFGVSLMGTFTTAEPTTAMMEAAAKVIAWKLDGHYRNPNGKMVVSGTTYNVISGHRDTKATECPGTEVYAKLPALRSRVWTLMGKAVSTEIYDYANVLGGFAKVGQPYRPEYPMADGGRGTWFTVRDIYWSSRTGAHSVLGPIRTRYRQLGHGNGVMGLPSAEQRTGRVAGSVVQEFSKLGARRVMYSSTASGAHELYDQLLTKYDAIGAETSKLGLPVTGPTGTRVPSSRYAVFQNGRMYYSPATGAHPVIGAINTRWVQSDVFKVGFPVNDEYAVSGGLAQDFEHGTITWDATTGETTLTLS